MFAVVVLPIAQACRRPCRHIILASHSLGLQSHLQAIDLELFGTQQNIVSKKGFDLERIKHKTTNLDSHSIEQSWQTLEEKKTPWNGRLSWDVPSLGPLVVVESSLAHWLHRYRGHDRVPRASPVATAEPLSRMGSAKGCRTAVRRRSMKT